MKDLHLVDHVNLQKDRVTADAGSLLCCRAPVPLSTSLSIAKYGLSGGCATLGPADVKKASDIRGLKGQKVQLPTAQFQV
jgi:hypothetical protein